MEFATRVFDIPKPICFPLQRLSLKLGEVLYVFVIWKDVAHHAVSCIRIGSVSGPSAQSDCLRADFPFL